MTEPQPFHDGLLALLGTAVGASVFAVGFASVRHHGALRDARRHARDVQRAEQGGQPINLEVERAHLEQLSDDLGTGAVAIANVVLLVVVIFAGAIGMHHGIALQGYATLLLFCLVEVVVVLLGYFDRRVTRRRIASVLGQPSSDPRCGHGGTAG